MTGAGYERRFVQRALAHGALAVTSMPASVHTSVSVGEISAPAPASTLPHVQEVALARTLRRPWLLVVWGTMVAWSVLLWVMARSQYEDFGYQKYDLGNMVQAVWSTAQGRPLEVTLGTGDQAIRLASHVDPILVLLAPIWLLVPSPLALAAVQIGVCASGALPVYWLAMRKLSSERAAGLLALAYLAYPWLAWTALDAMHPVTLAIPLFLFAIVYLDADRLLAFTFCAILVALTGELMALPLAALGVWYWLGRGRRRAGLAIALACTAWTAICIKVIVPTFSGSQSQFYGYYESIGGSPEGVVRTLVTDPMAIVSVLVTRSDLVYLMALTIPLGGMFLLAPGIALAAAPQFLANGLSSVDGLVDPRGHHIAAVIPFLVASTAMGIARLAPRRRARAAGAVLVLSASLSTLFGPWPLPGDRYPWLHPWYYGEPSDRHLDALRDAVALVPDDAAVSATNRVGSHLAAREIVLSVPLTRDAEWVVLDRLDPWVPLPPRMGTRDMWGRHDADLLASFTRRMERSSQWLRVFDREYVYVFRKRRA